jgi:hypothetical protein
VREVDDAHDPEDERQPGGHQEEEKAVLNPVQDLDEEEEEGIHARSCRPLALAVGDPRGAAPTANG